jgi:HEAT repeat protein
VSEVDRWLAAIGGEDEWARHEALETLRSGGARPERVDALAGALGQDDPGPRNAARMALAALASPSSPAREGALSTLRRALGSPDPDTRVMAVSAMGESGNVAVVPDLIRGLGDVEPNVAAAAADGLGALGAAEALAPLSKAATAATFWVRVAAVVALGRLRDPAAVPVLGRVASVPGLEAPVAEAIRRIDDPVGLPVLRVVLDSVPDLALWAAGSILASHPDVPPPDWVVARSKAAEAELLGRVETEDDAVAARLLGIAATPSAVEALLVLAGPPRRSEAMLNGLLIVPPEILADPVLRRLDQAEEAEPEDLVRLLSLLPPLEGADRVDTLVPLLGHPAAGVRAAAADALARSAPAQALPVLTAELGRDHVAPEVVRAAGSLGSAACVGLLPLLLDPDPRVRAAAADALRRCAGRDVAGQVEWALAREGDPAALPALLQALARLEGGEALPAVQAGLEDPAVEVRLAAIEAAAATGAQEAVPLLRRSLDGAPVEVLATLRALGELGGAEAAGLIEPFLASDDPDRRRAAASAALRLDPDLPLRATVRLAQDPDAWTRAAAVPLLLRHGAEGRQAVERLAERDPDPGVRAAARRAMGGAA